MLYTQVLSLLIMVDEGHMSIERFFNLWETSDISIRQDQELAKLVTEHIPEASEFVSIWLKEPISARTIEMSEIPDIVPFEPEKEYEPILNEELKLRFKMAIQKRAQRLEAVERYKERVREKRALLVSLFEECLAQNSIWKCNHKQDTFIGRWKVEFPSDLGISNLLPIEDMIQWFIEDNKYGIHQVSVIASGHRKEWNYIELKATIGAPNMLFKNRLEITTSDIKENTKVLYEKRRAHEAKHMERELMNKHRESLGALIQQALRKIHWQLKDDYIVSILRRDFPGAEIQSAQDTITLTVLALGLV